MPSKAAPIIVILIVNTVDIMDIAQIYNPEDTICAIATPPGTGAIAVLRLAGSQALAIADKVWRGKPLSDAATHTVHLGYIVDPKDNTTIDQAVATIFRGPKSFSGDDTVELSVHGSQWIQQRVLRLLVAQGARMALPGEYTRRAYATGRIDLAQAEAVADMISASSGAAHRLAVSQMRGQYSRQLNDLRDKLLEIASLLELELDFSEEDVKFASRKRLRTLTENLHGRLNMLANSFDAGNAIKNGVPVAIIGPTNAGKSSLLNSIVGDERAIVSDIHGTTRDIVEDTAEVGPYMIRFKDTAGLRDTSDTIEQIGISRSRRAAETASVIIYVMDATALHMSHISNELEHIDASKTIVAVNKCDVAPAADALSQLSKALPGAQAIAISAKTGEGITELLDAVKQKIDGLAGVSTYGDCDSNRCHDMKVEGVTKEVIESDRQHVIVTNVRHAAALRAAADSTAAVLRGLDDNIPADLIAQNLRETIYHLSTITGQITTPDILASIFQSFCIGK